MFPGDETMTARDNLPQDATSSTPESDEQAIQTESVKPCCVVTINVHARFNPMMVCSDCKHIIKCFTDESAYKKYLIFCKSRKRPVATGRVNEYHTVIFKSYDTFL